MSQTICRHGDKAENMRLAREKRARRAAKRSIIRHEAWKKDFRTLDMPATVGVFKERL